MNTKPSAPKESMIWEIRQRMRRKLSEIQARQTAGEGPELWEDLRRALQAAREATQVIGSLPPQPGTLRARIGLILVRFVQRTLFWYTPQVAAAHSASVAALDQISRALDELRHRTLQNEACIAAFEIELRSWSPGQAPPSDPHPAASPSRSAADR